MVQIRNKKSSDTIGSPPFKLSRSDLVKIAKGCGISAASGVLTYLANVVVPDLQNRPGANATTFVIASTLINLARKYFTNTQQIAPFWLMIAALLIPVDLVAQVQIVAPAKLAAMRASLPATEDEAWQEIFRDPTTLFYTEAEMPGAYQHADVGLIVGGGFGRSRDSTFHWTRNNISGDPTEARKGDGFGGNGNIEFPWRTPGGNDFAESNTDSFKMLWLPKRDDGRPWPVAFYHTTLGGSRMGLHRGYAWIFPEGTVFGEVLVMRDSRGVLHTYEVRVRRRELHYWDVDILRPFPTSKDLVARLESLDANRFAAQIQQLTAPVQLTTRRMADPGHPTSRGFVADAAEDVLPQFGEQVAIQLLDTTPFRSALGATWREGSGGVAFAPTSSEPFSIVPRRYLGTFLGTDTNSCAKCHESTLKHVDEFDAGRDWYGRIRGSDRIFSFHPIEPSSISPNGMSRPVRLRQSFVQAGIVETYDPARHPSTLYSLLKD